jgi:hypothetical protein
MRFEIDIVVADGLGDLRKDVLAADGQLGENTRQMQDEEGQMVMVGVLARASLVVIVEQQDGSPAPSSPPAASATPCTRKSRSPQTRR